MIKYSILGLLLLFISACGNDFSSEKSDDYNIENNGFIWDFSTEKELVYSYSQTMNNESKMHRNKPFKKVYMSGESELTVRVKNDKMANLSISTFDNEMVQFSNDSMPNDTMTIAAPAVLIQNMLSDGKFLDPHQNILIDFLFPLPSSNLKLGESEKIQMSMPFNANGTKLYSKGYNEITFAGYSEINGQECAVLTSKVNITEIDIPQELQGQYLYTTVGEATYYFDLEDQQFIGSDILLNMEIMMDEEGENEYLDLYMSSATVITLIIRLKEVND